MQTPPTETKIDITIPQKPSFLDKERENFRLLLNELKALSPYKDFSKYENYYKWDRQQLNTNSRNIKNKILKFKKRDLGITKDDIQGNAYVTQKMEHVWLKRDREAFGELLEELKFIKPNADISKYKNYPKWDGAKLNRNAKIIKKTIQKYKDKSLF